MKVNTFLDANTVPDAGDEGSDQDNPGPSSSGPGGQTTKTQANN